MPPKNKKQIHRGVEDMALSDKGIKRAMAAGNIIIEPFVEQNLSTRFLFSFFCLFLLPFVFFSSYDVTLGEYFFRQARPEPGHGVYNLWSEEDVRRVWGEPQLAEKMEGMLSLALDMLWMQFLEDSYFL